MTVFQGLCAFPLTPADALGRVDCLALGRLVKRLADARVDSIGLLGSTGTYMYLNRQERRRALEITLSQTFGSVPVIVGVGALRTDEAIALAQDARAMGAAAGLLAAVSYTGLTDSEVYEHFASVARESQLPLIIYDNPGTTHFKFSDALISELARLPEIIAIKNPGQEPQNTALHLADQRKLTHDGFSIGYSGDWLCTESMIAGADAWYSVLAGLWPKVCLKVMHAAKAGNTVEARRLNAELEPIWTLFRNHSSLRVMHVLANEMGLSNAAPPRPLLSLPEATRQEIISRLSAMPAELMQ
ncbi:dihydrodipicolinate synthase family protein [Aureimonas fodinaquatilis]|uniref:Dihydrodipicolinate synthase family protein n=1 Tax=Aureimonas fodinaquatilis TaxID=2565783 RepID=A0A5B0DP67_9HYPH|nr:dihydrodipicolinate synthase family protein [Aureimonas fodinaquatilis]KAA0968228.1 dihydrodipicolinate synthase family protein [Aureimonas fodinaquatilis]